MIEIGAFSGLPTGRPPAAQPMRPCVDDLARGASCPAAANAALDEELPF